MIHRFGKFTKNKLQVKMRTRTQAKTKRATQENIIRSHIVKMIVMKIQSAISLKKSTKERLTQRRNAKGLSQSVKIFGKKEWCPFRVCRKVKKTIKGLREASNLQREECLHLDLQREESQHNDPQREEAAS
jgi:hypothetical protein